MTMINHFLGVNLIVDGFRESEKTLKFKARQRIEAAKRVVAEKIKEKRRIKKEARDREIFEKNILKEATEAVTNLAENCSLDAVNQPTV